MDSGTRNYELAYLLSPSLSEEEVLRETEHISTLIQDTKGMIRHVQSPQKRRLAFPVKKEASAYFGWTTFSMHPETLQELDKKTKVLPKVLRHILVIEEEVKAQPLRTFTPRRTLQAEPVHREVESEEKLDLEGLDKKLEEILGK